MSTRPARPAGVDASGLPVPTGGISGRRQLLSGAAVVIGLPVVVTALVGRRGSESLAVPVLLVLLVVVLGALGGGLRVGLPAAVVGGLVLNWFFTVPYGTLSVRRGDQVVVLAVYLVVAAAVSVVVGVAARRTAEATRARAEAKALATLAGPALTEPHTLPALLGQVRRTFGLREAALLQRQAAQWVAVATSAEETTPDDVERESELDAGRGLRLRVRGPALFGEDQRLLSAFARAAGTAFEGGLLAARAAATVELEETDRMRTALLAAVSHDLRTPLAGVKAAVSSLRQSDVTWTSEQMQELLETIETSTDRLQGLLENLLDASRLQAGAVSISLEPVTLEEIVDRALLSLASPNRVHVELPEMLPAVLADVGLGERVLANLLDNALRHSPAGLVVEVRAKPVDGRICCDVIDHGAGIPRANWNQIFQPFQRLGDQRSTGVGLGLAVARGFTEAMNGTLEPTETPGGGLTMRLTLPAVRHLEPTS